MKVLKKLLGAIWEHVSDRETKTILLFGVLLLLFGVALVFFPIERLVDWAPK